MSLSNLMYDLFVNISSDLVRFVLSFAFAFFWKIIKSSKSIKSANRKMPLHGIMLYHHSMAPTCQIDIPACNADASASASASAQ